MKDSPLVWIDLETTGLVPGVDQVIEIGLVATDGDLLPLLDATDRPIIPFQTILRPEGLQLEDLDPFIVEMHTKSGLLPQLFDREPESAADLLDLDEAIADWVRVVACQQEDYRQGVLMAGSTVGQFDRQFFKILCPQAHAMFQYRNVDVSSVKEIVRRWYGEEALYTHGKKLHRALPDIDDSIAELRHYRAGAFRSEWRGITIR
jgi:oligoribonuclease